MGPSCNTVRGSTDLNNPNHLQIQQQAQKTKQITLGVQTKAKDNKQTLELYGLIIKKNALREHLRVQNKCSLHKDQKSVLKKSDFLKKSASQNLIRIKPIQIQLKPLQKTIKSQNNVDRLRSDQKQPSLESLIRKEPGIKEALAYLNNPEKLKNININNTRENNRLQLAQTSTENHLYPSLQSNIYANSKIYENKGPRQSELTSTARNQMQDQYIRQLQRQKAQGKLILQVDQISFTKKENPSNK